MKKTFDPTQYTGKRQIYVQTHYPGVRVIMDWNPSKGCYRPRSESCENRYSAIKKRKGVQKEKSFRTFEEAKNWRDSERPFSEGAELKGITFGNLKERYFREKARLLRQSTLHTYQVKAKHLIFFDRLLVSKIEPRTIDEWLRKVCSSRYLASQHLTRVSYEHELGQLQKILRFYAEELDDCSYVVPIKKRHWKKCVVNPQKYEEQRDRAKREYIPREVFERFLQTLKERESRSRRDEVCCLIGLFQLRTGSRIGEACAVRFQDLYLDTGSVLIARTVQWARHKGGQTKIYPGTKTGKSRVLPLTDDLVEALVAWRTACGRKEGLVFSLNGEDPIGYRSIQFRFDRAFKILGVPFRSTHILRHSFATDFLDATGDQSSLKDLLGHEETRMTDHYAKVTQKMREKAMRRYSDSFKPNLRVIKGDAAG